MPFNWNPMSVLLYIICVPLDYRFFLHVFGFMVATKGIASSGNHTTYVKKLSISILQQVLNLVKHLLWTWEDVWMAIIKGWTHKLWVQPLLISVSRKLIFPLRPCTVRHSSADTAIPSSVTIWVILMLVLANSLPAHIYLLLFFRLNNFDFIAGI